MSRQQHFDWFLSQQRLRKSTQRKQRSAKRRQVARLATFEPLEVRNLLSANAGQCIPENAVLEFGPEPSTSMVASSAVVADSYWYVPAGESLPEDFDEHEHHTEEGSDGGPAAFTALAAWPDQDPIAAGIQITYSYSNFFDGGMGSLTELELRQATEEALLQWALHAPLHFIEVVDGGPLPDDADTDYPPEDFPNLRIGHHFIDGAVGGNVLAHAFLPFSTDTSGLAGDVHFDNGNVWGIGSASGATDVIEVMTHELGHSLGLGHEESGAIAIMNPVYTGAFPDPGTIALYPDDIAGIQDLYGVGEGSVTPLKPLEINTLLDVVDEADELLSLREAITLSAESDGRLKIAFSEAVFVDPGTMQTIVLDPALGALNIPTAMEIRGPGSDLLTLHATDPSETAGDGFSIFDVVFADPEGLGITVDVTISGFTLSGADSNDDGGAIYSTQNLTLEDIHAEDNHSQGHGGSVYSSGSLSVIESTIGNSTALQDGGGIYSDGDTTLVATTLYNNTATDQGGGLALAGTGNELLIQSSTISGNSASDDGGGLHLFDFDPFRLRLLHSTVHNNHSDETGGGVYLLSGALVSDHSIIAGNTITDPANPSAVIPSDVDNVNVFDTPTLLANYTLIGDSTGAVISHLAGNLVDVNPQLGPLELSNGALVHHLSPGSPALDTGDPSVPLAPEFDQRGIGFDRIVNDVIDLGAIESQGFDREFIVDTLADESDGHTGEGQFSLREAIEQANAALGNDEITFAAGLDGGTILLDASLGELLVTDALTIKTPEGSKQQITIQAGDGANHRIFRVDDSAAGSFFDFKIESLALLDGNVAGKGGAIYSVENLALHEVTVMGNTASGNGGGVYHLGGALVIENSAFVGNTAVNADATDETGDGGGLWSNTELDDPYTGRIRNSTFSGNDAGDEGGGIFNDGGLLALEHVTITDNIGETGGGVVSFGNLATETTVYSSIISGNESRDGGFGLDVQRSRETPLIANTFESLGYNLIGTGNALLKFDNHDQTEVMNAGLADLAYNGGKTPTHALLPTSKAIDAGNPLETSRTYAEELLELDPFLHWSLDETLGTTVFDSIGTTNGDVGSVVSLVEVGAAEQAGSSARFGGLDSEGLVNDESVISSSDTDLLQTNAFGDQYSISLWVNADAGNDLRILLRLDDPSPSPSIVAQLRWSDGQIVFRSGSGEIVSDTTLSSEEWHHVVIVSDLAESRIYLDGQLDLTNTTESLTIDVDTMLSLGKAINAALPGLNGSLDEVLIFDSSLSDQDVTELYRSTIRTASAVSAYDQRGANFDRVEDGLIGDGNPEMSRIVDVGAFELAPEVDADFDDDGDVDGSDFLAWQRGFGKTPVTQPTPGDADVDGDVDDADLSLWTADYGSKGPEESSANPAPVLQVSAQQTSAQQAAQVYVTSSSVQETQIADMPAAAVRSFFINDLAFASDSRGSSDEVGRDRPESDAVFETRVASSVQTPSVDARQAEYGKVFGRLSNAASSTNESIASLDLAFENLAIEGMEHDRLTGKGRA